jgi:hypothetical protein
LARYRFVRQLLKVMGYVGFLNGKYAKFQNVPPHTFPLQHLSVHLKYSLTARPPNYQTAAMLADAMDCIQPVHRNGANILIINTPPGRRRQEQRRRGAGQDK